MEGIPRYARSSSPRELKPHIARGSLTRPTPCFARLLACAGYNKLVVEDWHFGNSDTLATLTHWHGVTARMALHESVNPPW